MKIIKRTLATAVVLVPVGLFADTTDPLAAATTQIGTWAPLVSTALVGAFSIPVAIKAFGLGKRILNKA